MNCGQNSEGEANFADIVSNLIFWLPFVLAIFLYLCSALIFNLCKKCRSAKNNLTTNNKGGLFSGLNNCLEPCKNKFWDILVPYAGNPHPNFDAENTI